MRHGPAEDDAHSGHDGDRALTASGRERCHHVARTLAKIDEVPARIISSPLVRAMQTAEIVAHVADVKGQIDARRELAPGGNHLRLVHELSEAGAARVMVVGHEPDLSTLVDRLLGKQMPEAMGKGMVVALKLSKDHAELRFILEPKTLEILHDAR
jgi:phosphohistidine phosphatase